MRTRARQAIRAGIALSVLALLPLAGNSTKLYAAQNEKDDSARKQPATTNEKDQVDLAVTVYNSNIALVRDVRQIHLPSGTFPLHFEDVAGGAGVGRNDRGFAPRGPVTNRVYVWRSV